MNKPLSQGRERRGGFPCRTGVSLERSFPSTDLAGVHDGVHAANPVVDLHRRLQQPVALAIGERRQPDLRPKYKEMARSYQQSTDGSQQVGGKRSVAQRAEQTAPRLSGGPAHRTSGHIKGGWMATLRTLGQYMPKSE